MSMRRAPCVLTCLCMAVCAAGVAADEHFDDFSAYPDGSDGAPVWDVPGVFWEVEQGAMRFDGPMTTTFLRDRPRFRTITVEAVVRLERATSTNWKIAGVSVYDDADNFWHLALVESPDTDGARHFCELAQRHAGEWPSQSGVRRTVGIGGDLQWESGRAYRLTIALTPQGIEGRVLDEEGAQVAHIAYEFTRPTPSIGRPALRASGLRGRFEEFRFTGADPVPDPPPTEVTYPEFDVTASDIFTSEATGFYRTERRGERWWLVDPRGRAFYALGTDHCRYGGHWCQALGHAPYGRNNDAKYDSREQWAEQTVQRLKSWGFNLVGAGNGPEVRYKGLAHTGWASFGSTFSEYDDIVPKVHWTGFPNVFSPKWPRFCDRQAAAAVGDHGDDPWLFGYFLDNELEWFGQQGKMHLQQGLFEEAMKKPADHTAKIALVDFLRDLHGTIGALNEAWGTELASFDDILALDALSGPNIERVRADKLGFVRLVAELYFKHTTEALRRHAPNHLILGCRFAGDAPAGIWDIAGKYCDIVSFNYYGRVDLERGTAPGHVERFTGYYEQAQKPLMITEWSFPALDSGLPCKHGAGMRVDTQAQKAECFRIYQEMFLRLPFMVGSNYFMWVDQPELGVSDTFPEDSNYGLVNEQDEVYEELTQMAARVHATAYALHSGDYPEVGLDGVDVAFNTGRAAATMEVFVVRNGVEERFELTLAPGERRELDLRGEQAPGANMLMVELDPDRKIPDGDRENNRAVQLDWAPGVALPEALRGRAAQGVIVANQTAQALTPALAVVTGLQDRLPAPDDHHAPQAYDLEGRPLPSQMVGDDLVVLLERLAPWDCRTLLVAWAPVADEEPGAAPMIDEAGLISNGPLTLAGPGEASGNLLDRIALGGVMLGTYNPLVWQEVGGQNLWVRTDAAQLDVRQGPVGALLHGLATGGVGRPITAVNTEGRHEQQRSEPVGFEVAHDIIVPRGTPWFLARLDCITNTSDRPLLLKGYFFYLNGLIGGSAEGDRPAGPEVPNYYAMTGGAWQDDEVGLVFGTVPLHDAIAGRFWLSAAGGQHPDARRELQEPLLLEPGETYRDPHRPWLLIYGAPTAQQPWRAMGAFGRALADILVELRDL